MSSAPRKASLFIIFLVVFIDLIGFGMVLPLLPIYGQHFARVRELTPDQVGVLVGLLMASFSAMQFLFAPMWGRLSDRIGRRPVLLVGLAGSVVFYSLFGYAAATANLVLLFVSRIGAGVAGATISTAQAYIADTTELKDRTKGMALIGAAFGLGFTFGPMLAYFALWDGSEGLGAGPGYVAAGISAVALVLAWRLLPESLNKDAAPRARKWFDFPSLRDALTMPSIGMLLLTSFVCIFSFSAFEATLSLLIKTLLVGDAELKSVDLRQTCLVFAYIGILLLVVQGGIVRRVAGRFSEITLAFSGACIEAVGFLLLIRGSQQDDWTLVMIALAVIVSGFAFITPSLQSLISRRSDPAKQGGILGVAQSVSALARIGGPYVGVRLLHSESLATEWGISAITLPLWFAALMLGIGLVMLLLVGRRGRDFTEPTDA